jgi:phage terminase small subunit
MAHGGGPKRKTAAELLARGSKPTLVKARALEERAAKRAGVQGLTKSRPIPPCPKALKGAARAFFLRIIREFALEPGFVVLLTDISFLTQTIDAARQTVAQQGMIITDAQGRPMPNPAGRIERQSIALRSRLIRQLDLPED